MAFIVRPEVVARLATAVRNMPEEMATKKGLGAFVEDILAWLDVRRAPPPRQTLRR